MLDISFRPLAGIMVLINIGGKKNTKYNMLSFRPLAGIMVLIRIMMKQVSIDEARKVSVPLRGLWFLSTTRTLRKRWNVWGLFPSPCGDYGSYLGQGIMNHLAETYVSVPLRGLWFLSMNLICLTFIQRSSFRPLAGIMVLI